MGRGGWNARNERPLGEGDLNQVLESGLDLGEERATGKENYVCSDLLSDKIALY